MTAALQCENGDPMRQNAVLYFAADVSREKNLTPPLFTTDPSPAASLLQELLRGWLSGDFKVL